MVLVETALSSEISAPPLASEHRKSMQQSLEIISDTYLLLYYNEDMCFKEGVSFSLLSFKNVLLMRMSHLLNCHWMTDQ